MTDTLTAPAAPVKTTAGPVLGLAQDGVVAFKGLRYGAPPIGAGRFAPPRSPEPWRAPAEAFALGAPALQAGLAPGETTGGRGAGDPPAPGQPGTSEDCLFLNVWTPACDGGRRPVMVWLHGGGFAAGSGGAAMYDGAALARRGDAVIVTLNHRLNVFGYLHLADLGGHPSSGLAGMLDIVLALRWVRDNIAAFGGDPETVTIFGESGGGAKVALLMAMPDARGLFARAVIQSGPLLRATSAKAATATARTLFEALGLAPGDIAGLAATPAAAVVTAAAGLAGEGLSGGFSPCVDGVALPRDPFAPDASPLSADIPLLIGTNKDEATLFMVPQMRAGALTEADVRKAAVQAAGERAEALIAELRRAFPDYSPTHLTAAARTASWMWIDSVRLAERKAAGGGAPVYMYRLDWETPVARGVLKSPHAVEIPLVVDTVETARNFVGRGDEPHAMADLMAPAWLAFARTGHPGTAALPGWPAYEAGERATMVFDLPPRLEHDPMAGIRTLLGPG